MRQLATFVGWGVLWVAVQTFWVSVIWRGDIVGYLLEVAIVDVGFALLVYGAACLLRGRRWAYLALYAAAGAAGLVGIEWLLVGNWPGSEASQLTMFTTWAGVAGFALLATSTDPTLATLRRVTVRAFLIFAGAVTAAGLVLLALVPGLAFAVTYLGANIGYPIFAIAFVWAGVLRLRAPA